LTEIILERFICLRNWRNIRAEPGKFGFTTSGLQQGA
jgi:hypothetical protein